MAITAAQFADFLEPGLSNIWHESDPTVESVYARLFNMRDMNKDTIQDLELGGFGDLQTQADGDEVQFDDPLAPRKKSYTYAVRALAYRVHERAWMNDLYGEVAAFEQDLKRSANDDVETAAANVLNNGFGSTNTGFDGLGLFSTAHTRLDGGANQRNNPSTDAALSVSALHTALIDIKKWVNHRGRPVNYKAKKLIIPPDLMMVAYEILDSKLRSDTAENATNVLNRFSLEDPVIWTYLTSTTAWFVQCDEHDLNFFWRFRPQTGMRTKWETDSIDRKVRQGYVVGFGQWLGMYGTDGVA